MSTFPQPEQTSPNLTQQRRSQAAVTMKWLEKNYCPCEDVCLPRGMIYEHYLDFCRKCNITPACKATFGKMIRSKFPGVTSKRLGARGHSKYHYNGIRVKQNSTYHVPPYVRSGVTRFSRGTSEKEKSKECTEKKGEFKKFFLSSKVGTLLPKFPKASDLEIPERVDKTLLQIFLTMYRIHCQCLVDTTVSGNFEELNILLVHFWHGLPEHLLPLVSETAVVDVIAACDCMLYKTLLDVLFPRELSEMPEKLLCGINNLGRYWASWMKSSLENLPTHLSDTKLDMARDFEKSLKRHAAFLHIVQVIRPILNDFCSIQFLLAEIDAVRTEGLYLPTIHFTQLLAHEKDDGSEDEECCSQWSNKLMSNLQNQLQEDPTVEAVVAWLDNVIEKNVLKDFFESDSTSIFQAKRVILNLNFSLRRIGFGMSLRKSKSFVVYHLLSLMMLDYFLLSIETKMEKIREEDVYKRLKRHLIDFEPCDMTPTSCVLMGKGKRTQQRNRTSKSPPEMQHLCPYEGQFHISDEVSEAFRPIIPEWNTGGVASVEETRSTVCQINATETPTDCVFQEVDVAENQHWPSWTNSSDVVVQKETNELRRPHTSRENWPFDCSPNESTEMRGQESFIFSSIPHVQPMKSPGSFRHTHYDMDTLQYNFQRQC